MEHFFTSHKLSDESAGVRNDNYNYYKNYTETTQSKSPRYLHGQTASQADHVQPYCQALQ